MNTDESQGAQTADQNTPRALAAHTEREEARAALEELGDRLEEAENAAEEASDTCLGLDDMAAEAAREAGCDDAVDGARDALSDARAAVRRAIRALDAEGEEND
jgi:hypothetical protein